MVRAVFHSVLNTVHTAQWAGGRDGEWEWQERHVIASTFVLIQETSTQLLFPTAFFPPLVQKLAFGMESMMTTVPCPTQMSHYYKENTTSSTKKIVLYCL